MRTPIVLASLLAALSVWQLIPHAWHRGPLRRQPQVRWTTRAHSLRALVGSEPASHAREVATLTSALAAELRSGQVPDQAWKHVVTSAADEVPGVVVPDADVTLVLRRWAQLPGWSGLGAVAVCWQMADETGAGLADALDRIGEAMRHEYEVAAEVSGQLSSTRATAVILATLPLVAVAMGSLLGADPLHVLTETAVGAACLVLGLSLIGMGWWWIGRQVAAVRMALRW